PVWVLLHLPLPAETGLGDPERRRLAWSERAALHAATGVICTSAWAREDLLARYGPLTVHVAEPGTDDAPLARGSQPLRLLTIASLTPRKNHLTLLEALGRLGHRDWQAHWVGPEASSLHHRSRLRAALAASPVAHRIRVTGPLQGELLQREWHAADLLVLPSLAETYGMVVTEALARGIPALVGAGTGAEATLRCAGGAGHGLPGDAVDATDPTAVADALDRWLGDPGLRSHRRRLAIHGRGDLQPWSRTTALILDIVDGVDR
nr:glycosyltransferase family 4 protein [Actinomycetota bacterium]